MGKLVGTAFILCMLTLSLQSIHQSIQGAEAFSDDAVQKAKLSKFAAPTLKFLYW